MAELNFNALTTPGPRGFYQGFEQGQTEKLTTDINQFKFDELKRDRDEMLQLQTKLKSMGQDPDIGKLLDVYVQSGKPDLVKAGIEGKQKLKDLQAYSMLGTNNLSMSTTAAAPAPTNALASQFEMPVGVQPSGATTTPIVPQTSVNAMVSAPAAPTLSASTNNMDSRVLKTEQRITQLLDFSRINPRMAGQAMQEAKLLQDQLEMYSKRNPNETPDVATMRALGIPITQEGFAQYNLAKQRGLTPPSMVGEYNFAKTLEGGGFKGTFQEFVTARAAAGRAPAQPRAEPQPQPPIAVVDPATGKQVFVSREEALTNRMTPAAAMESIAPKEIQKREAAFPQATASIKGFETKSAAFVKDLEMLRDSPGLDSITGIAAGRLPGITQSGRAAQALYDKVTAKGGFQALQDMRDASKTGGALGNVSNQEGKQLTASFAAIDRRQDSVNVKAALNQAIADIQGSQTRMREAYDSTYSYKSGGTGTAPSVKPAGVDTSNPLLK